MGLDGRFAQAEFVCDELVGQPSATSASTRLCRPVSVFSRSTTLCVRQGAVGHTPAFEQSTSGSNGCDETLA